jgi:hypothetical protein
MISRAYACAIGGVVLLSAAPMARAVVLFVPDTFTDGTVQEWYGGDTVTNVGNGQLGAADRFITVATNSTSSSGSHLATHNAELRWSGDFLAASVTAIQVDMRNLGSTPLQMRLVVFGLGNRWTSVTAASLPVGGAWQHLTFPVNSTALTRVLGTGTYSDSLMNVSQVMFRHDTDPPSSGGTTVSGMVGIDNPMAVPAPGFVGVLAPFMAWSMRRPRRRYRVS